MKLIGQELALGRHLPLSVMAQLSGVSRSSVYRWLGNREKRKGEEGLRRLLHSIAGERGGRRRFYGYRRMSKELRRRGHLVNAKRVYRLMSEDGTLQRKRRRRIWTTNSRHGRPLYPNLASQIVPAAMNELWVADITYVKVQGGMRYLAFVLDAYTRTCVGYAESRRVDSELTLKALRMALAKRDPAPGLIHHSDRGSQYASRSYVALLHKRGIRISMSRKANPYDNALVESFIKTVKMEAIEGEELPPDQLLKIVSRYIDTFYNTERLHSAIGYQPPAEFEADLSLGDHLN